jgi:hypothetical protein
MLAVPLLDISISHSLVASIDVEPGHSEEFARIISIVYRWLLLIALL